MARGHQKIQSQQKAQEKAAKLKKQEGHSAHDQKKAAQAALKVGKIFMQSSQVIWSCQKCRYYNHLNKTEL